MSQRKSIAFQILLASLFSQALSGVWLCAQAEEKGMIIHQDNKENVYVSIDPAVIPDAQFERKAGKMVIVLPGEHYQQAFVSKNVQVEPSVEDKVKVQINSKLNTTTVTVNSDSVYLSVEDLGKTRPTGAAPKAATTSAPSTTTVAKKPEIKPVTPQPSATQAAPSILTSKSIVTSNKTLPTVSSNPTITTTPSSSPKPATKLFNPFTTAYPGMEIPANVEIPEHAIRAMTEDAVSKTITSKEVKQEPAKKSPLQGISFKGLGFPLPQIPEAALKLLHSRQAKIAQPTPAHNTLPSLTLPTNTNAPKPLQIPTTPPKEAFALPKPILETAAPSEESSTDISSKKSLDSDPAAPAPTQTLSETMTLDELARQSQPSPLSSSVLPRLVLSLVFVLLCAYGFIKFVLPKFFSNPSSVSKKSLAQNAIASTPQKASLLTQLLGLLFSFGNSKKKHWQKGIHPSTADLSPAGFSPSLHPAMALEKQPDRAPLEKLLARLGPTPISSEVTEQSPSPSEETPPEISSLPSDVTENPAASPPTVTDSTLTPPPAPTAPIEASGMQLLSRMPLGKDKELLMVAINGQQLLVASTPQGINLLGDWDESTGKLSPSIRQELSDNTKLTEKHSDPAILNRLMQLKQNAPQKLEGSGLFPNLLPKSVSRHISKTFSSSPKDLGQLVRQDGTTSQTAPEEEVIVLKDYEEHYL